MTAVIKIDDDGNENEDGDRDSREWPIRYFTVPEMAIMIPIPNNEIRYGDNENHVGHNDFKKRCN